VLLVPGQQAACHMHPYSHTTFLWAGQVLFARSILQPSTAAALVYEQDNRWLQSVNANDAPWH